jgi:hypothetical protein
MASADVGRALETTSTTNEAAMRQTVKLLVGIALLAGCGSEPTATLTTTEAQAERALTRDVRLNLEKLRQVTDPFHDIDVARDAGWSTPITACLTDPEGTGAMGYHYGNTKLIDGSVKIDEPELLLYEPQPGGGLQLVAVEYIVPLSAWHSPAPPRLFGRNFHVVQAFQVWALHAWVWKQNPNGIFTDWNPLVSCANATSVTTVSHH